MWDSELSEVLGEDGTMMSVTGARVRNVRSDDITEVTTDGIFIAIGHSPSTSLFRDSLRVRPSGCLWTSPVGTSTDISGVFAAGDVTDDVYRQAVTAAGQGCMAALEAEKYLGSLSSSVEAAE